MVETNKKTVYVYTKERLGAGEIKNMATNEKCPANSGMPASGLFDSSSIRSFGQTPSGQYVVQNVGVRTGGIIRGDLVPIGHNAKGRTNLQIHEKSTQPVKAALNLDSKGCIATDMAKKVKNGDIVVVRDNSGGE